MASVVLDSTAALFEAISRSEAVTEGSVGGDEGPAYAPPHPLIVPELASMIVDNLGDDKRTIFSAMLVHPTWTPNAIPLLWRSVDLDKAFAGISGERRQLYADYVCRLSVFASGDQIMLDNPPLPFPRLQALYIDARTRWQLNAKKRRGEGASAEKPTVWAPETGAPGRLYNCLLRWLTPSVTSAALVNYDDGAYASVIRLLLRNSHLADLGLHRGRGHGMEQHFSAVAADTPPRPLFQSLRVLTLDAQRWHVPDILATLRHAPLLTSLALLVPGELSHGVLPALRALAATLQLVQLEFDADVLLQTHDMLSLRALTQLRELVIQPPMNTTFCFLVAAPGFTAADLVHLLAGLPQLRRFVYGGMARWWTYSEERLLQRIGHAAPRLEELGLAGSYKVQELEPGTPTPAFPCLRSLMLCQISLALPPSITDGKDVEYLRDIVWHDVMREVKTSIRHHMPCLRSLSVSSVEPFYCRLIDWVLRTRDSTDPLTLDDEEDEEDEDEDEDVDMCDGFDGTVDYSVIYDDLFPSG